MKFYNQAKLCAWHFNVNLIIPCLHFTFVVLVLNAFVNNYLVINSLYLCHKSFIINDFNNFNEYDFQSKLFFCYQGSML